MSRPAAALLALLAPASAPLLPACGGACTEIGCADSNLEVFVEHDAPLADGSYTITLSIDGEPSSCTVNFPAAGLDAVICGAYARVLVDAEAQAILSVRIDVEDEVRDLSVAIRSGEADLASGTWEPNYDVSYPNGERCPPICRTASETLTF